MIDARHMYRPTWERPSIFKRLTLHPNRPYGVLTLHRPSNVDDPVILMNLLNALQELARHLPLIFPVHPRVRLRLAALGHAPSDREGITYLDPLGYLDFIALVSRARLILTDSGGLQEESTALGVPCLTLRETTERPITITHGTNRVIGTDPARIVSEAHRDLNRPHEPIGPPLVGRARLPTDREHPFKTGRHEGCSNPSPHFGSTKQQQGGGYRYAKLTVGSRD